VKRAVQIPKLTLSVTLSGSVFINRGNRKEAVAAIKAAGEDMKRKGISLWIFPEGTRASQPEPSLLPFKMGAFHLAIQAQVPIVVCVCESYNHLFDGRTRFDSGKLKIKSELNRLLFILTTSPSSYPYNRPDRQRRPQAG
jgi:1-acyl-sn-glycerol-3-phosphate acyltransferase